MFLTRNTRLVMKMSTDYECIHEEQIQTQSRKIERLEARSDFKEQRIDELNTKMDNLNSKFDTVIQGFNDLKMQSTNDDKELELRLKTIETELELQKKVTEENRAKLTQYISIVTVIFVALTFYFNFLH